MLLGFKSQFAPFVLDGSKTHTIRGIRKNAPRVGETCHCYVNPRKTTMALLGRWPCVKVDQFFLDLDSPSPEAEYIDMRVDGSPLSWDEKNALAFRDGFRTGKYPLVEMLSFWRRRLPFIGQIIHWDYSRPIATKGGAA